MSFITDLFVRKDRPARPSLREALAANKAKQDARFAERRAELDERNAARLARAKEKDAAAERVRTLVRQANDRLATSDQRDQAVAELIALRGERKARQILGAYSRLQARGWIRS